MRGGKSIGSKNGFTLIELLVVIAVISFLASLVFTTLASSRARARDARRKQDLGQIRTAIELYLSTTGALPGGSGPGNCNGQGGCTSTAAPPWIPGLTSEYISILPVDPLNNASFRYRYRTDNDTLGYELDAPVEYDFESAEYDGGNANTCPAQTTCRYEIGPSLTRLRNGP